MGAMQIVILGVILNCIYC